MLPQSDQVNFQNFKYSYNKISNKDSNIKFKITLLVNNWKDLFILNLVQWLIPLHTVDDKEVLQTVEAISSTSDDLDSDFMINSFIGIKSIFVKLIQLNLDVTEFELFKLTILMRYGKFLSY